MDQTYASLVARRIKDKIEKTKNKIKETEKEVKSVDNSKKTPNKASFPKTFITATTLGIASLVPGLAKGENVQPDNKRPTPAELNENETWIRNNFNIPQHESNAVFTQQAQTSNELVLRDGRVFIRDFRSIDKNATIHIKGIKLCDEDFLDVPEEQVMIDAVKYASNHSGLEGGCTAFIKRGVIKNTPSLENCLSKEKKAIDFFENIVYGVDFEKFVNAGYFHGFSVCDIPCGEINNISCFTVYRRAAPGKAGESGHCGLQEEGHDYIGPYPRELGLPQKCVKAESYPSSVIIIPTKTLVSGVISHQRSNPEELFYAIRDTNGHYTVSNKLDKKTMDMVAEALLNETREKTTFRGYDATEEYNGVSTLQITSIEKTTGKIDNVDIAKLTKQNIVPSAPADSTFIQTPIGDNKGSPSTPYGYENKDISQSTLSSRRRGGFRLFNRKDRES